MLRVIGHCQTYEREDRHRHRRRTATILPQLQKRRTLPKGCATPSTERDWMCSGWTSMATSCRQCSRTTSGVSTGSIQMKRVPELPCRGACCCRASTYPQRSHLARVPGQKEKISERSQRARLLWFRENVGVVLLQDLLQSCLRGGGRIEPRPVWTSLPITH